MHIPLRSHVWRAFRTMLTALALSTAAIGLTSYTERGDASVARAGDPTIAAAGARPAAANTRSTCDPAPETPVPDMVGSIFRCRLAEAALPPDRVKVVTAEAVTVAACESEFDPHAVVFDGRYLNAPHPSTGAFHSAAGVFQFIRDHADVWVEGGYANVTDPAANINAAARMYLHNIRRGYPGWSDWACAAANDGFRPTSVLPGWPGGPPQLPAWAFAH